VRLSAAVHRLAAHAPPIIVRGAREREVCVLATRVGIETLRRVGVEAEPWPVRVVAANRIYYDWLNARPPGPPPTESEYDALRARGGYALDVGHPDAPERPNAWRGHLIVRVPALGVCVDLNAGAFARPQHGIPIPPSLVIPWGPEHTVRAFEIDEGAHVVYYATPSNRGFEVGIDWMEPGRDAVQTMIAACVRAVRRNSS
jgi:hypothetical protein